MDIQDRWEKVDQYISEKILKDPEHMDRSRQRSLEAGIPQINVSSAEGKLIHIMAGMTGAKKALEIGVLWGCGSMYIASALKEGGQLIGLERDRKNAAIALKNLQDAGLDSFVEIRIGDARDSLKKIRENGEGPFDLIFIDADKKPYAEYFSICMEISHPGTIIIVDNMVWNGKIVEKGAEDEDTNGIRSLYDHISERQDIEATVIQTVGSKGYDGFAVIRVK